MGDCMAVSTQKLALIDFETNFSPRRNPCHQAGYTLVFLARVVELQRAHATGIAADLTGTAAILNGPCRQLGFTQCLVLASLA
jgi:hypothetical protein